MNLGDTLAVLDTCTLLPPRLSDVVMDLRHEKLFSCHWTSAIDAEYLKNMQKVFSVTEASARRRLDAMKRCCPEWEVLGWELDLDRVPAEVDAKDKHVAAAALVLRRYANEVSTSTALYIVSANGPDLARKQMREHGVVVIKPGTFLDRVYEAHPREFERAVSKGIGDLQKPPYSKGEFLGALVGHGAKKAVATLAANWNVVPVKKPKRKSAPS